METSFICTNCILPDTTPGISFDHNGVCNYCLAHQPMKVRGEEKLIEILQSFKTDNKKYDCVVGISGGRDSTYTLWKLVKEYKMKVLALHYKNPFDSEQACLNMQKALKILNVDCITWEFPNDIHRKATRKNLAVWAHNPSSLLIPIVCGYCKTGFGKNLQIARENKIHLYVIGSNPIETPGFKKAGLGGARTYHRISNFPNILAKSIKQIAANPRYLKLNWNMVLKMYLAAGHSSPYLRLRYKDITVIRLFDYIKWDEKKVVSSITNNLGWQKSPEIASPWRFDCRLDYVRRLMYASTVGVTELRDLFSKMIREKQMTREEALQRISKEDVVSQAVVEEILEGLGLKLADLNLRIDRNLLV